MLHSTASRISLVLVLAFGLGLPLSVLPQDEGSGTDLTSEPANTDLRLGTDALGTEIVPWPGQQDEPSRPGLTFALWALSLASLALGITTCYFLIRFVREIDKAQQLGVSSHWGGFGGGLGGWQISPALAHLAVALVFGSLTTLLILRLADLVDPKPQKVENPPAAEGPATAGSGVSPGAADGKPQ